MGIFRLFVELNFDFVNNLKYIYFLQDWFSWSKYSRYFEADSKNQRCAGRPESIGGNVH